MLRFTLAVLALAPAAMTQSLYDFNNLTGSDIHPYIPLDGQDGWSEQTYNARNRCGVTATLSHDGTQSLRFQEVGPGFGCDASRLNDTSWSFPLFAGSEVSAYFMADMQVGYWGGSFGLAHDTNSNGVIRHSETGERGVLFTMGTHANVQLQLIAADGTATRAPISSAGAISGGDWVRVLVVMDLAAAGGGGLGSVGVANLTTGATDFTPVPSLQNIPLALNPTAADATNPTIWDAMWLHFEGATYGLDNIQVGHNIAWASPYGAGCGFPAVTLHSIARPVLGTSAVAETFAIPPGSIGGSLLLGVSQFNPGLDLTGIGMPGCYLLLAFDATLDFTPTGLSELHTLPLPSAPWLAGASVYMQTLIIKPGVNQLGMLTSNGLRLTLEMF